MKYIPLLSLCGLLALTPACGYRRDRCCAPYACDKSVPCEQPCEEPCVEPSCGAPTCATPVIQTERVYETAAPSQVIAPAPAVEPMAQDADMDFDEIEDLETEEEEPEEK